MKVLVVDDEPLIRLGLASMLEDAGFETFEAGGADSAIEVIKRQGDIRLVVTDVDMPGSMDGLKLAHYVRHNWPPIALIVISGKVGVASTQLPANARFFSKPYPDVAFMQAVRELLSGPPHGAPA